MPAIPKSPRTLVGPLSALLLVACRGAEGPLVSSHVRAIITALAPWTRQRPAHHRDERSIRLCPLEFTRPIVADV